jgi:hypothetical protein
MKRADSSNLLHHCDAGANNRFRDRARNQIGKIDPFPMPSPERFIRFKDDAFRSALHREWVGTG